MIDEQTLVGVIAGYDTTSARWRTAAPDELVANGIDVEGDPAGVAVYLRDGVRNARVTLAAPEKGRSRVFLGDNLHGSLRVALRGSDSTVYIGDNCRFNDLVLRSRQDGDLIAIGDDVAVTGPGAWVSGLEAAPGQPALVVGDCCLLAAGVTLRNSDGHPVLDRASGEVVNVPSRSLLIEPHAWLGERSAVLKGVTIGAFARIAFGSVVTRNLPRYAVAQGAPASYRVDSRRYWAWDATAAGRARATAFLERFPPEET